MSTARGKANQSLYLARILVGAWRRDLAEQGTPASVLAQAYLGPIRSHLQSAYGWFLLEITRPGSVPDTPPGCIAELPETAAGKATPPEVREFAHLEASGWIADMLAAEAQAAPTSTSRGNLLTTAAAPDPDEASRWADSLQDLFDRMGNALDEC